MQKIAAFKTEDGSLHESAGAAHDHEIRLQTRELAVIALNGNKEFSNMISEFVTANKDKLLTILEKPKL